MAPALTPQVLELPAVSDWSWDCYPRVGGGVARGYLGFIDDTSEPIPLGTMAKRMDFPIEPSTKVAALLDRYPELEDVLIGLAPPFVKLKNPILRRSVAKVASLRQAAAVGRLPVAELVNTLRAAVGQETVEFPDADAISPYFSRRPAWFDEAKIVVSIDETKDQDGTVMPVVRVHEKASRLQPSEILELITTHLPAPGIDLMKKKGFLVWSVEERPHLIRTYFHRPKT